MLPPCSLHHHPYRPRAPIPADRDGFGRGRRYRHILSQWVSYQQLEALPMTVEQRERVHLGFRLAFLKGALDSSGAARAAACVCAGWHAPRRATARVAAVCARCRAYADYCVDSCVALCIAGALRFCRVPSLPSSSPALDALLFFSPFLLPTCLWAADTVMSRHADERTLEFLQQQLAPEQRRVVGLVMDGAWIPRL